MNFAGLLGILSGLSVLYFVITGAKSPVIFADKHGAIIVIGGTVAVAFLSFRSSRLIMAIKIVFRKLFGNIRNNYLEQIRIIVETADLYRLNPKATVEKISSSAHPFFRDGIRYMIEFGFSAVEIDEIMTNSLKGKKMRDDQEIKVWHTISRFPPAFGLLGATVGMISLLQTLGEPNAQDNIGPAMATALVATFYGLVVANLVLIPISENLAEVSDGDMVLRKIIKEGILLIQEKRHPLYIEEYLKSFLAPALRQADLLQDGQKEKNAA